MLVSLGVVQVVKVPIRVLMGEGILFSRIRVLPFRDGKGPRLCKEALKEDGVQADTVSDVLGIGFRRNVRDTLIVTSVAGLNMVFR